MSRSRASSPRRLTRPYTLVGGRTHPTDIDLALEAQVARTPLGESRLPSLRFEQRDIMLLCSEPVSVAELAARLRVPLGVARVLLADMVVDHLVEVATIDFRPSVRLLKRVLHGLHAI